MDVGAVASIQCASGLKAEAVPNVAVSRLCDHPVAAGRGRIRRAAPSMILVAMASLAPFNGALSLRVPPRTEARKHFFHLYPLPT
jgi:hypothetical protein